MFSLIQFVETKKKKKIDIFWGGPPMAPPNFHATDISVLSMFENNLATVPKAINIKKT